MRGMIQLVIVLATLAASAQAQSPSVTKHPAPWLANAKGHLFFSLSSDGGLLLTSRSPCSTLEELVVIPTSGGEGVVWHSANTRAIYDRIGLSGDGKTVVFAATNGSTVYALTKPGAKPRVAANIAPDSDPRQIRISHDGKWVAFTASQGITKGDQTRVHGSLYVAATDGTVLHRITQTPTPERRIPFDLSADGKSVVWVDDPKQGPWIADVSGKNARRIAVAPAFLGRVRCDPTAAWIYFESIDAPGSSHMWRIKRDGTGAVKLHSTQHGRFFVARGSGQIRLERFDPKSSPPGSCTLMSTSGPLKMFQFGRPDAVGTSAWSDDGKVFVWRTRVSSGEHETLVWRAGS